MELEYLELLWPYGADSGRPTDQLDVVVEMKDGSRWSCAFHDTARYNRGVPSFRGLGEEQTFRVGPRLVIVQGISDASVRDAVVKLLADGRFADVFERVGEPQG